MIYKSINVKIYFVDSSNLLEALFSNIIAGVSLVVVLINKLIVSINFYMVLYLNL